MSGFKSTSLQKRSILFVVGEGSFFVSHRLNLAVGALNAGYQVAVACPKDPVAVEAIRATGARWIEWGVSRGGTSVIGEAVSLVRIWRIIGQLKPTLIHAIGIKCILHAGIAARFFRAPIVAAVSGLGYVYTGTRQGIKRILQLVVNCCLHLALNRRGARLIFQNVDDSRIVEIARLKQPRSYLIGGSGVDLKMISMRPHPRGPNTRVGLPARLLRDKGVYEFVEAARELKRRGRDVTFLLIGNPDPKNPTSVSHEEIEGWAQAGTVEWLPHTNNIADILASLHIVALPSYREGFPKTLIDAAAAGRAAVATDVPGCRDAIVDEVTGLLCAARDVRELADAIDKLVCDRDMCISMGAAARLHAELNFRIESVTERHLAIYDECIPSRAPVS